MTTTTDPHDPTAMALPVIGDLVRLTDGTEGRVMARSNVRTTAWRVQNGDPFTGTGWSRWVELHEIAGYPEAEQELDEHRVKDALAALTPGPEILTAEEAAEAVSRMSCTCKTVNVGGCLGGCTDDRVADPQCPVHGDENQAPPELPADDIVASVLNAAIDWHAATQAGGSFLDHAAAADALHAAVRAYLPLVGE